MRPEPGAALVRLFVRFLVLALALLCACAEPEPEGWQGYVEGEFVYVASPRGGQLTELAVVRGTDVSSGELLFRLDPEPEAQAVRESEDLLAQAESVLADRLKGLRPSELASIAAELKAAKAALQLSSLELARRKNLLLSGSVAREEVDQAQTANDLNAETVRRLEADLTTGRLGAREDEIAQARSAVEAAREALAQARWNLSQKTQAAPAAATVFDLLHYRGEWVAAGKPVVALLPPENVKVRFFVPEPEIGTIRLGEAVNIRYDGAERPLPAFVSFIAPKAEYTPPVIYSSRIRARLVFLVEARPAQPDDSTALHPGQPVWVVRSAGSGPGG